MYIASPVSTRLLNVIVIIYFPPHKKMSHKERVVVDLYEVHEDELAEDGGDAEESQPVADVQDGVFQ